MRKTDQVAIINPDQCCISVDTKVDILAKVLYCKGLAAGAADPERTMLLYCL